MKKKLRVLQLAIQNKEEKPNDNSSSLTNISEIKSIMENLTEGKQEEISLKRKNQAVKSLKSKLQRIENTMDLGDQENIEIKKEIVIANKI